jgi:hypothetical protein
VRESHANQISLYVAYVLVYELLIGQGLKGKTALEKHILRNKSGLHASLERLKIRSKVKNVEDLLPEHIRAPGKFLNILDFPEILSTNNGTS